MNFVKDINQDYSPIKSISQWNALFTNCVIITLGIAAGQISCPGITTKWSMVGAMEDHPFATDEDKKGFWLIKMLLHGREALEIERSLAEADVKKDVLDKIEKLDKDLMDMAIAHLSTDAIVKVFLKKLSYYQIEQNKRLAEIRLKDLQLLK